MEGIYVAIAVSALFVLGAAFSGGNDDREREAARDRKGRGEE